MGDRPIKKWRAGNFDISIWSNKRKIEGGEVEFKTVSLNRSYRKKGEDIWRNEVINLRRMDIPKAITLLNKAYEELVLTEPYKEVKEDDKDEEE